MSDDCQEIWRRLVSTKIKDARREFISRKSWKAIYIDSSSGFTINKIGERNDLLIRANSPFCVENLMLGGGLHKGFLLQRKGAVYFNTNFNEDIEIPIGACIKPNDEILVYRDHQSPTVYRVVQTGIWPSSYLYRKVACKSRMIPKVFPLVGIQPTPTNTSTEFDNFVLRRKSVYGYYNGNRCNVQIAPYVTDHGHYINIAKFLRKWRRKAIRIRRIRKFYHIENWFWIGLSIPFKTIDEALTNLNLYLAPER